MPPRDPRAGGDQPVKLSEGHSPWRRGADVARLTVLVSVPLGFAVTGVEGSLRFALVFLVLLAPRALHVPGAVDAAFGAGLLVAAWGGTAGWYDAAWWVDVVVHFFTTGITAAATYLMLVHLDVLVTPDVTRSTRKRSQLVLLVVALGLAIGGLWELYEWVGTNWLGNTSIHVGYDDTILDLTMDAAGSLTVALILIKLMPRLWRNRPRPEEIGGTQPPTGSGHWAASAGGSPGEAATIPDALHLPG